MSRPPRIALVAGEVSGDWLAAGLIEALRSYYPDAQFEGVTGPRMREAGCVSLADINALSLFGVSEVVGEIPRVLALRRRLYRRFTSDPPDVFVGIDAPAFNTGLERRLRQSGVRTVHYVCPTAWAWREGRVRGIRLAVDRMLAIFPFEPAFFRRHAITADYVGHRLADELPMQPDVAGARQTLGVDSSGPLVALLPGSRGSEVKYLGPAFIRTAQWLQNRLPGVRYVAPMASTRVRKLFEAQLADLAPCLDVTLVDDSSRDVMTASDAILLASGTATLEALLLKTPMVVAYAFSPFNAALAGLLGVSRLTWFSMPNLIAERGVVPELRQAQVKPEILGPWLYRLLTSAPARARQVVAFAEMHERLRCGADERAAAVVGQVIDEARGDVG